MSKRNSDDMVWMRKRRFESRETKLEVGRRVMHARGTRLLARRWRISDRCKATPTRLMLTALPTKTDHIPKSEIETSGLSICYMWNAE